MIKTELAGKGLGDWKVKNDVFWILVSPDAKDGLIKQLDASGLKDYKINKVQDSQNVCIQIEKSVLVKAFFNEIKPDTRPFQPKKR